MLITCPECELKISDKALACPHCGYPIKGENKPRIRKTEQKDETSKWIWSNIST